MTNEESESTRETVDRQYKDDRDDFGQSSDVVRDGKATPTSGQSPESSDHPLDPNGAQGNNHGSQKEWQRTSTGGNS